MAFRTFLRQSSDVLLLTGKIFGALYLGKNYVVDAMWTVGPSMQPTLGESKGVVLISPLLSDARLGDVVVCKSPVNPSEYVVKRIIGMPGDVIKTPSRNVWDERETFVRIPTGHVWLQGDNYHNSRDSRFYGPVPQALIVGRVLLKLYPFGNMGTVPRTMKYSRQDWSQPIPSSAMSPFSLSISSATAAPLESVDSAVATPINIANSSVSAVPFSPPAASFDEILARWSRPPVADGSSVESKR